MSAALGVLALVLASPAFHRRHHTTQAEGLDKNFAGLFPLFDLAFGTLYPEYTGPGTSHVFSNARAYADLGRLYGVAGVVDTMANGLAITAGAAPPGSPATGPSRTV